jgi:hypothetical protein
MRRAVLGAVLLALGLALLAGSASGAQRRVDVVATVEAVRVGDFGDPGRTTGDFRSEMLLLWTWGGEGPIGHVFVACHFLGQGGLYGGGVESCQFDLWMPLGKIRAGGTRHATHRYSLPVIGGTGLYEGIVGSVVVRREFPRRLSVLIRFD